MCLKLLRVSGLEQTAFAFLPVAHAARASCSSPTKLSLGCCALQDSRHGLPWPPSEGAHMPGPESAVFKATLGTQRPQDRTLPPTCIHSRSTRAALCGMVFALMCICWNMLCAMCMPLERGKEGSVRGIRYKHMLDKGETVSRHHLAFKAHIILCRPHPHVMTDM